MSYIFAVPFPIFFISSFYPAPLPMCKFDRVSIATVVVVVVVVVVVGRVSFNEGKRA